MPDKRCYCDHRLWMWLIYTHYNELFPQHCNALLFQGSVKTFSFYFPFTPWRRYHRFIKFIETIHPRLLLVSFNKTAQIRIIQRADSLEWTSQTTMTFVSFISNMHYMWRITRGNILYFYIHVYITCSCVDIFFVITELMFSTKMNQRLFKIWVFLSFLFRNGPNSIFSSSSHWWVCLWVYLCYVWFSSEKH